MWTERHTYMVREMSTNVIVRYIHGQLFVHVDMISSKILKPEKNLLHKNLCFYRKPDIIFFHYYEQCYQICSLKGVKRGIYQYSTQAEGGYKLSIVHVDNTYMVKEMSTNVHQT